MSTTTWATRGTYIAARKLQILRVLGYRFYTSNATDLTSAKVARTLPLFTLARMCSCISVPWVAPVRRDTSPVP